MKGVGVELLVLCNISLIEEFRGYFGFGRGAMREHPCGRDRKPAPHPKGRGATKAKIKRGRNYR